VPSIRVLGSGSRLSMLITSDSARVLIASGDDATAFGNALGRAKHLTSRRIDIVVIAGDASDIPVARHVRKHLHARQVFVMDGPLTAHLSDLGLGGDDVIAKSTRIRLPGGIDVTITPVSPDTGTWSAVIQHGATTVVVGNAPSGSPDQSQKPAAVVFTDSADLDSPEIRSSSVIVLSSRAATPAKLRDVFDSNETTLYALRVQPATTARLTFVDSGLRLDSTPLRLGLPVSS
jgi:hypothetical protein